LRILADLLFAGRRCGDGFAAGIAAANYLSPRDAGQAAAKGGP